MEDYEIIYRITHGEPDLFEVLIRRYQKRLYALAWRMLHNRADAEDAVQEALMKAYKGLKRFRGDARFSTWVYRITVNLILNRLRKGARFRRTDLDLSHMESSSNPVEYSSKLKLRKAVAEAIEELPPRQRAIFQLRYQEERPHKEIAEILGISEGASKAAYHHAVAKLRNSLSGFVDTGDAYG